MTGLRTAVCACLLAGAVALPGLAQDAVFDFAPDDPDMQTAISTARSHLDVVLSQLTDEKEKIHPALNLKVRFPVQHADVEEEVIWVDRLSIADGRFAGTLANAPTYMAGVAHGDPVTFDRSQITDWSVLDMTGRMYGHYTTRVILDRMPPADAEPLRDLLTPEPLPEVWR